VFINIYQLISTSKNAASTHALNATAKSIADASFLHAKI
jgi:hypothetical protein